MEVLLRINFFSYWFGCRYFLFGLILCEVMERREVCMQIIIVRGCRYIIIFLNGIRDGKFVLGNIGFFFKMDFLYEQNF